MCGWFGWVNLFGLEKKCVWIYVVCKGLKPFGCCGVWLMIIEVDECCWYMIIRVGFWLIRWWINGKWVINGRMDVWQKFGNNVGILMEFRVLL